MFIEETVTGGSRQREFDLDRSGRLVPGVLWQGEDTSPDAPLVCCGHGASGNRHQDPIPWLARRLTARNINVLSLDGPVHGRRQVGPGGREAFMPEFQREGTAQDMVADWQLALEFVRAQPEVGNGPTGYFGLSMGTIYGAPLVAEEPSISVAVLGLMGIAGPRTYRPVIEAAAARIDCPVLFIQQLEDELFTREQYAALFDAIASNDKRLHANPGLHPEVPMEELEFSTEFLTRHLSGSGTVREVAFSVSS